MNIVAMLLWEPLGLSCFSTLFMEPRVEAGCTTPANTRERVLCIQELFGFLGKPGALK